MEGREILLCFFVTLLVQIEPLLQSRCEESSLSSKTFLYKDSFTLCRRNKSVTDEGETDWCTKHKIKPKILECERGRVILNIPSTHPNEAVNRYYILLRYIYNETCDSARGIFNEHSSHEITVDHSIEQPCIDQDMELLFDYAAKGCYQIKISPVANETNTLWSCTQNFTLETDFVMTPIAQPKVSSSQSNNRTSNVTISGGVGLFLAYSVLVKLKNTSSALPTHCCSPDHHRIEIYNKQQHLPQCYDAMDGPSMPPKVFDEGCSCVWDIEEPYMSVKCIFYNLVPGLYTVSVIINDPRCILADSNCSYFVTFNVTESITSDIPPTINPPRMYSPWIWCTAIVLIIIACVVIIFIYNKYKLRPVYDYIHPSHGLTAINKKIKILLLYPRDCEPFMKAMESFRTLLESIKHFEVYDALDPAQEEEIALNTKTWGLDLLTDSSTKVILVASWCSLRFYEALLDKDSIRYLDRRPSDHLFLYHLDHLFEQNLQYKRIYVVRLDCNNAENLIFEHIAQNRIFTLPQFTETLVNQLLELSPDRSIIFEEESSNEKLLGKLCDAIEKYSAFVDTNPNYLNTIIKDHHVIDTQTLNYVC